jgi:hypothetical protein
MNIPRAIAGFMVAASVGETAVLPYHHYSLVPNDHLHSEAPAEPRLVGNASVFSISTATVLFHSTGLFE